MAKKMHDLDKKLFDLTKLKAENKYKVKLNKKQLEKFVSKYGVFPSVTLLEKDLVAYIEKLGLKKGAKEIEEEDVNPLVTKALKLGIKTISKGKSVVTVQMATDEQLVAAIEDAKEKDSDPVKDTKPLEEMNHDELKVLAKSKGVKSWHLKSAEKLFEALKALDKKE